MRYNNYMSAARRDRMRGCTSGGKDLGKEHLYVHECACVCVRERDSREGEIPGGMGRNVSEWVGMRKQDRIILTICLMKVDIWSFPSRVLLILLAISLVVGTDVQLKLEESKG